MCDKKRAALVLLKNSLLEYRGYLSLEFDQKRIDSDLQVIDAALAEPDVDIEAIKKEAYDKGVVTYSASAEQVQRWISEAYEEGKSDKSNDTVANLLNLPQQIKEQSKRLADSSIEIEKLRAKITIMKLNALELVTGMKDGDKQRYSNDKARTAAQERLLADDTEYCANCDELGRLEYQQKLGEIEHILLRDTFRATIAIAEMR